MTLCECGCGQETTVYRGVPKKFVHGHHRLHKKHSNSAKKKLSEASKGSKHTSETKLKIGNALKHNKHNWMGGISFEPYCPKFNYEFKESIREKFGRVCFMCGAPENGRKLSVHHVNYDKSCLCSEIECEFVPLCASCHGKTSNGDREYWESLILDILATYK